MKSTATLTEDTRWAIVCRREESRDFLYAVITTGIYCRPGCASRLPKRRNVRFFDDADAAKSAGFRPCKRCRPDQEREWDRHAAVIANACRLIESTEEPPTLKELARENGYSPAHFQRLFKQQLGVSPSEYAQMRRTQRVRSQLLAGMDVTSAMHSSGYRTSSHFYEETRESLGMKPSEYRSGAKGLEIRFATAETTLGLMLVAETARGICFMAFAATEKELVDDLARRFSQAEVTPSADLGGTLASIVTWVNEQQGEFPLPLDIHGTAFQKRVWNILRTIPQGTTMTYTEIAEQMGQPTATRAVANACGANKLAPVIPCHRVVRRDGGLGGYRWGIKIKERLLADEQARTSS